MLCCVKVPLMGHQLFYWKCEFSVGIFTSEFYSYIPYHQYNIIFNITIKILGIIFFTISLLFIEQVVSWWTTVRFGKLPSFFPWSGPSKILGPHRTEFINKVVILRVHSSPGLKKKFHTLDTKLEVSRIGLRPNTEYLAVHWAYKVAKKACHCSFFWKMFLYFWYLLTIRYSAEFNE